MKTKEQIEMARDLIYGLQDYVELAKVEKKLKIKADRQNVSEMIRNITDVAKSNINEL